MQVKLLRVLQERVVQPIGATKAIPVDVRIVAATHRDLRAEVARGAFREDLFYRLAVLDLRLPRLRDRLDDLPELAAGIIQRVAEHARRTPPALAPSALRTLAAHPWPGNVRELENVLTKATLFCDGDTITAADVEVASSPPQDPASREAHVRAEAERITSALRTTGWNVSEAARSLGIPRASFYRKLHRHGLLGPAATDVTSAPRRERDGTLRPPSGRPKR
jgi:serine/threonine-protein kinase PknK